MVLSGGSHGSELSQLSGEQRKLKDGLGCLRRDDPKLTSGAQDSIAYVTFTFQKIGAPNLSTSRTFLRKAVGWNHSPHGT